MKGGGGGGGGIGCGSENLKARRQEAVGRLNFELRNANLVPDETSAFPAVTAGETSALSVGESVDTLAVLPGGNGNGRGIFAQIKDRLANAAKVRDLKSDLAKALGVSKNSLKAQFHNVEHHRAHLASSVLRLAVRARGAALDRRVRRFHLDDVGQGRREQH